MKHYKITIQGGKWSGCRMRFFNLGKKGEELYEKALSAPDGDSLAALLDEYDICEDVIMWGDDYCDFETDRFRLTDGYFVYLKVEELESAEDDSGEEIFSDYEFSNIENRGFILCDPRKWRYELPNYDRPVENGLAARIKNRVAAGTDEIEKALAGWKEARGDDEFDAEFGNEYLTDFACEISSLILDEKFADAGCGAADEETEFLYACAESDIKYPWMCGRIALDDDEEFDPDKLVLLLSDYDDYSPYGPADSILPVAVYGDKFFRLSFQFDEYECIEWKLAQKEKGKTWMKFTNK